MQQTTEDKYLWIHSFIYLLVFHAGVKKRTPEQPFDNGGRVFIPTTLTRQDSPDTHVPWGSGAPPAPWWPRQSVWRGTASCCRSRRGPFHRRVHSGAAAAEKPSLAFLSAPQLKLLFLRQPEERHAEAEPGSSWGVRVRVYVCVCVWMRSSFTYNWHFSLETQLEARREKFQRFSLICLNLQWTMTCCEQLKCCDLLLLLRIISH